jgi:NAD(P)-dependent dehydrogenase (short-subunit alcohol dehydrogenase family)
VAPAGIGYAIAERLGRDGNEVVIAARNEERLAAACEKLRALGIRAEGVSLDVRDHDAVEAAIEGLDSVDGVVNNAAGNFVCHAEELSPNGFRAVVEISLYGTFHTSGALARRLIREGKPGAICNIIATYAWTGAPYVAHSAAAKAAMLAFAKSVAREWGDRGIRVNCVAPGFVATENAAANILADPAAAEAMRQFIPVGRFGEPEEIAAAVRYLMSDEARYVTGAVLSVDGGRSLGPAMHAKPRERSRS